MSSYQRLDDVPRVTNSWKQFQDTGSIERNPGQGRPRATTAIEDCHLSIIARRNRGLLSSLVTSMQPQEPVCQGFHKDFMREGSLRPTYIYEQESPFSKVQTV
ncbi:uncharacterized protein TNCV_238561 [Trichonephila clavipes]|nr:uncharacterized protein TNCV_238561 [Trichonephila clavipes]